MNPFRVRKQERIVATVNVGDEVQIQYTVTGFGLGNEKTTRVAEGEVEDVTSNHIEVRSRQNVRIDIPIVCIDERLDQPKESQ